MRRCWPRSIPRIAVRVAFSILLVCVLCMVSSRAYAHKPSDSYLTLQSDGAAVALDWHIAIRDLDDAIGIDTNSDGTITGQELHTAERAVLDFARGGIVIERGAPCTLDAGVVRGVVDHSDGTYAALHFVAQCVQDTPTSKVTYNLFFELDPQHRGILRMDGGEPQIVGKNARTVVFDIAGAAQSHGLLRMAREGVKHIWTGYDHILFLLALLLPSVLLRRGKEWQPQPNLRRVLAEVFKVVTAFTLAHSVTLSLAALGVVALPSRLVESVIAASVIVAAANNVVPFLREDRWLAAFVLGLMHGFGFSSTLSDLGLSRSALLFPLVGFNLGVEVGQMAIVLTVLPIMFLARKTRIYRVLVLRFGSVMIALVALVWLIERAFDLKLIS